MSNPNIVQFALQTLSQVRYMHWVTTSYHIHKELGNLYERLDELIDRFVESYLGTHLNEKGFGSLSLPVEPVSQTRLYSDILIGIKQNFKGISTGMDSALKNIIDEITGAIDQTLYLIAMK